MDLQPFLTRLTLRASASARLAFQHQRKKNFLSVRARRGDLARLYERPIPKVLVTLVH